MTAIVIERFGSGGNQRRVVGEYETLADAAHAVSVYNQSRADALGITLLEWNRRVSLCREGERRSVSLRIKGGEKGFRAAAKDALYGRGEKMMSPSVRWSRREGFTVEPAANLYPLHDGEVQIWNASFSANTGKPNTPDYSEVQERIVAFLRGELS